MAGPEITTPHTNGQPEHWALSEQPGDFGTLQCHLQRTQRYLGGSHVESFLLKKGNHLAPECTVSPGSVYQDDVCFRIPSFLLIMSVLTGHLMSKKTLLVAPCFFDHLRKISLAQPSLKRSLGVLQQLCHCLFMSAARSARLFFWILVN